MMSAINEAPNVRPVTGRTVLLWLGAFFGVMAIANAAFVYFAVSSFPGVDVDSAYTAGQTFAAERTRAADQASRGWQVDIAVAADNGRSTVFSVTARDDKGLALPNIVFTGRLRSPKGPEFDRTIVFSENLAGRHVGDAGAILTGRWTMVLDGVRDDERLFRSVNEIRLTTQAGR